ncbi:hypothetical protein [Staphylococcus epidermidis]|uniref:hypothetical protein n=1 Tax=Staphylococcus epidermidis TaxID=1282 RepID=UPI0021A7ECBA|nr:hypothetical protein [Staphylococcus epidermidis]MCT1762838.1 hypothetical protein [Staphylococcus epidermidis]MCT1832855.1 hypothetical protein [Staphylococcus epidermidis]
MAEIKTSNLSFKQINAIKILDKELKRDPFLLINFNELVNDLISERESFRKQRDELINDMAETKRKAEAFDFISNFYTTEIEQALRNKELNQCLFLLDQILGDLERGSDEKI